MTPCLLPPLAASSRLRLPYPEAPAPTPGEAVGEGLGLPSGCKADASSRSLSACSLRARTPLCRRASSKSSPAP